MTSTRRITVLKRSIEVFNQGANDDGQNENSLIGTNLELVKRESLTERSFVPPSHRNRIAIIKETHLTIIRDLVAPTILSPGAEVACKAIANGLVESIRQLILKKVWKSVFRQIGNGLGTMLVKHINGMER